LSVRLDEGLLVRDELVDYGVCNFRLGGLNVVPHPSGCRDTHNGRYAMRSFKMGFALDSTAYPLIKVVARLSVPCYLSIGAHLILMRTWERE
jgi:hypothetical protein